MAEKMELLAPAGGMEQLKAAIRFGADAVYGGMKSYGLRAFAGNFDSKELQEAVCFTHKQGKKFYLTLNLLPKDSDLEGFIYAATQAVDTGVDAAIVSDLGAALLLQEQLPGLSLHISTQANVLNTRTALHYHQATGARRIILSRELTMADICDMRRTLPPDIELEAFVHGAMCVAYSGRCLLSNALTGRSGNRGACAQPCRWQYHVVEEKRPGEYLPIYQDGRGTYLFSAWDLCMLPHLHELLKAGLSSLKIEGRMKSAYYAATVVSAYRRAMDILQSKGEEEFLHEVPALMKELQKVSHRSLNTGFYYGMPNPAAGAEGFSQTMEYVGDVVQGAEGGQVATVALKNRFNVGDALEVLSPHGSKSFTVDGMIREADGRAVVTEGVAGTRLRMIFPFAVSEGDLLRGPNRNHRSI